MVLAVSARGADAGELSWPVLMERYRAQRDQAREERDEARVVFARGIAALQTTAGRPSDDFEGAVE